MTVEQVIEKYRNGSMSLDECETEFMYMWENNKISYGYFNILCKQLRREEYGNKRFVIGYCI